MNAPATANTNNHPDNPAPGKPSRLRTVFRFVKWTTYVATIITLFLVFHAAPPPTIVTSPQAAAQVERRFEAVEQAVASGQSATLRLDQTELNSYLTSHLDISPAPSANVQPSSTATESGTSDISTPMGTTAEQVEQVRSTVRDVKVELIDD